MKSTSPLIIAHRGESFDAPENTMTAINLAWERGAEAVEIDIQLSKDGEIVVIHDTNTKRLAGLDKKVRDQTLKALKQLDVGLWKDLQYKDERIPTLSEVLDTVPGKRRLIIEIKSGPETIPVLKIELKKNYLAPQQIEIIGFDLETMVLAKKEWPNDKVFWLLDLDYNWYTRLFSPSISRGIKEAKKHKLDGLNLFSGNLINKKMIDKIHRAGLLAYCWTVNDIEKARKLMRWGIDAITTDGAEWMRKHLF